MARAGTGLMGSLYRASQIVTALVDAGVRATVDPPAIQPPGVLLVPPGLTFDLACGATARWQLVAIAPAAQTGDRTSWAILDDLVESVTAVLDVESADLVAYTANGRTYPAYLLTFEEAI